jgi:heterodisulfide reductase subunit A-like polyferredoxin
MNNTPSNQEIEYTAPQSKLVGAVMVVGGGISGIQSALDLADQGFKVYLVENKSAIGGHMAQLDKTFPTNDCAMCNISPKLVDAGRHLNIEILTNTDVLTIDGKAGNFKVTVRHRPRFIDQTKCIGCGDCEEVCPISLLDTYEENLKDRKAAYRLYAQAVPSAYAIEKLGTAPCREACPAGQRAQGYISLIGAGRYKEALRVIKEDNPFPSVCGRTCHHPCEGRCSRAPIDNPVNIMGLKRFVVDYSIAYGREPVEPVPRTRPQWIAVIGAGPAGLTAAHDLAKMGYGVTVYEALPVAGGMMRVGIPAHRLPKGVLQQDIDDILALGVVLKTNTPIKDPTELLSQGYNAVCMATGISTHDHSLGLEGEDAEGVISAATFLRSINLGEPITIGNNVAVIGGGITALDAAAVARRLGAEEVYLALDRPRGELPAYHWETAAVEAEGIHLLEKTTATRILAKNGKVVGVEFARTSKGMQKDKSGRRVPNIKDGTEHIIDVDTVIGTVGQFSDLNFLNSRFDDINVDRESLASEIPGLFVVGGRKTGASYIIEAIALGHRVANSINNYLQGQEFIPTPSIPVVKISREELADKVELGEINLQPRIEPTLLPMEERVTSFREVVLGITEHQARAEAERCLQCGVCSECLACEYACGVDAIDHSMIAQEELLQVGSVVLAPGFQIYNSALSEEYGYGRFPNVITALQFERLLSASGPTGGHVHRPSDDQLPTKIAFLQCVGSRDQDHDYCSAVCCMYATKEAVMAKEHHPDLDIHVFMMDMRAFSKGYLNYFERARDHYGVQYTRCRISSVHEDPKTHNLIVDYQNDSGELVQEIFDLVVLSIGMEISTSVRELGNQIGVELDEYGFCHNIQFNPVETSREGIYAVGPFREPKDIPESVIEASAAAAASASLLAGERWSLTTEREFPSERDVLLDDEPRVGVFVCHCGSNIGGFLDVPSVTDYARDLPNVTFADHNLYSCSHDSINLITEKIKEHHLNRVVVASCSPLTHAPLFQDSLRSAGLNPYLFEMANIRNQCSWVHSNDWDIATNKAKDLVRMAVARAALLDPRPAIDVAVNHAALVVGGGVAGMTAALTLAEQGYTVHLVEKEAELGGNVRNVFTAYPQAEGERNPRQVLNNLLNQVKNNNAITTHMESEVIDTHGFVGNFTSTIQHVDMKRTEITHGITILATGAQEYRGPEYGYGTDSRIMTQQEFEAAYANDGPLLENCTSVAMIQCIGPAENYCSRICCSVALKNALAILERKPETKITIFYKDIRTYGFKEKLYTEARRRGVIFVRYDDDHPPQIIRANEYLQIESWDLNLKRELLLTPNLIVLSMPVVPNPDAHKIATLFKVPVDSDGFLLEAHVKLRPVDFATDGIFMAGMAHYPKLLDETMIQAQAASSRAARVLSRDTIRAGGRVALVNEDLCTGCLTCARICPFGVPLIKANLTGIGDIMGAAYIEPAICQGCGSCVAECPARAIQLMHYTDAQMITKVSALVQPVRAEHDG